MGGHGVPWQQGEDDWWPWEVRFDQEQDWQDRQQEAVGECEEALRGQRPPGLDEGSAEGSQGASRDGLRGGRRQDRDGQGPLREGEVLPRVSHMTRGWLASVVVMPRGSQP